MRRIPIQLDEATYAALRRRAFEEGKSIAAFVRESIAEVLGTARSRTPTLRDFPFVGIGRSRQGKLTPVSKRHDEALAQTAERKRRR